MYVQTLVLIKYGGPNFAGKRLNIRGAQVVKLTNRMNQQTRLRFHDVPDDQLSKVYSNNSSTITFVVHIFDWIAVTYRDEWFASVVSSGVRAWTKIVHVIEESMRDSPANSFSLESGARTSLLGSSFSVSTLSDDSNEKLSDRTGRL